MPPGSARRPGRGPWSTVQHHRHQPRQRGGDEGAIPPEQRDSRDPDHSRVRRESREREQRNAARVLGVETIDFLGFPDCELENTRETRLAVTGAIRRHRPDLIICQNPNRTKNFGVSHRDHRVAADIVLDCVYPLARDPMAFPELLAQGLEPHKVKEVHTMWWDDPEIVVDISETIDLKIKALLCHVSQMKDVAAMEKRVRERNAELGKGKGFAF